MKKLLAVLLIAAFLTGCSFDKKNNKTTPTPPEVNEKIKKEKEYNEIIERYLLDVDTRYSIEDALTILFIYLDDDPVGHNITDKDALDAFKVIRYYLQYVCPDEDVNNFSLPQKR